MRGVKNEQSCLLRYCLFRYLFCWVGCVYFISILKYRCVYILIISFKSGRISSIFIVHNNCCAKFKFLSDNTINQTIIKAYFLESNLLFKLHHIQNIIYSKAFSLIIITICGLRGFYFLIME